MDVEKIFNALPLFVGNGTNSKDTIDAYVRNVKLFMKWMKESEKDINKTTEVDAAQYVYEVHNGGVQRDGVNQRIAACKAFFRTAIKIGEFEQGNPFAGIKGKRATAEAETKYYTPDEIKRIYEACEFNRDRAIILLMAIEGLRTVEIVRMQIEDYKPVEGKLKVHGKGGHEAWIYPSDKTQEILQMYIGQRKKGEVFRNFRDNTPLTRDGVRWIVDSILIKAGLKRKGNSCHALRHSCGTNLYEATKDIRLVQETLRHYSPEVTSRYVHVVNRKNATNKIVNF